MVLVNSISGPILGTVCGESDYSTHPAQPSCKQGASRIEAKSSVA